MKNLLMNNHTAKWMKGILPLCFTALFSLPVQAQPAVDGTPYCLPKTAINVTMLIEKKSEQPGELHQYASRFLKKDNVITSASTTYRIVDMKLTPIGLPDTTKQFTARVDGKHSIERVELSNSGIILAVNTDPAPEKQMPAPFKAAPKNRLPNPHDYMNQDILSAGSTAKMAELTAQEIYDIRDSRSLLTKGQADFMPKDGEQLRIMMESLNQQEKALLQVFEGTTTCDTTEVTLTYLPQREGRELLFRFSKKLGMVDNDDMAGEPFYIQIADLHSRPVNNTVAEGKVNKDDANIFINLPGRIKATIAEGNDERASLELYAAQFGTTERLDTELFGRKLYTTLVYNPVTGNLESQKTDLIKKK